MHGSYLPEAEAKASLEDAGYKVADIRLVMKGATQPGLDDPCPPPFMIEQHDWAFDEVAETWRAPGEACTEPEGNPDRAVLEALFDTPRHGWMPLTIRCGSAETTISCSDVFDPLHEIVDFARRVASGYYARLLIDEEGVSHELFCYPKEGGLIRLVVLKRHEEDSRPIDALLDAAQAARAFGSAVEGYLAFPYADRWHWAARLGAGEDEEEIAEEVSAYSVDLSEAIGDLEVVLRRVENAKGN